MLFASAVSRELHAAEAGRALGESIQGVLGDGPVDLACLFFSSHYADRTKELSLAVREALNPRVLIGCTGEGIIADAEEIERAGAVALWAAVFRRHS